MTLTWSDPTWRAEALDWAATQLALLGWQVAGPITQPHVRPWSTAFRIPTDAGVAWCKASGSGPAYEGRLLEAFEAWGVRGALLPMATDVDRALILTPDGGPTLRETRPDGTGDHDLDAWARILRGYAALQRSVEPRTDDLVGMGVPDGRPDLVVGILTGLVDDDAVWARAESEDRAAAREARHRLPGLLPVVAGLAGDLAGSGIAASIQHDDLHGGNILVGPAGDRIFDWGDAAVEHPFTTLTTTMNSIEYHTGLDQHGRELRRLRDSYLEGWSDVAPLSALVAAAEAARVLGAVSRAAAWERSFQGVAADELAGHGGSTAAWLVELVERLDRVGET
jgi:Phosphotransferase enzyme family